MRTENKGVKKKRKLFVYLIIVFTCGLLLTILLWYQGMIIPNASSAKQYPMQGVDVSSYQGEIDWGQFQEQGLKFAFIKATEGSTFVDQYFEGNWKSASKTTLRVGAYHFFSFDSGGETQAENFIKTVPVKKQGLPPVIDVEFYGDKEKNPPVRSHVEKELQTMVEILEKHYGKKLFFIPHKRLMICISKTVLNNATFG